MHSPYENIIIGNFLYGLGLVMGKQPQPAPGCVNLLQQTPLDPVLGDVMVHLPGVWRLIEFKRKGADLDKELAKLELLRGALIHRPHMEQISRRVHWFVESDGVAESLTLDVCHYLDLHDPQAPQTPLNEFVESMIREAFEKPNHALLRESRYLALIKLLHGRRDFNASGLLVGVSSTGGLIYAPIPNMTDLRGTASMLRERMIREWRISQDAHTQSVDRELQPIAEKSQEKTMAFKADRELSR